MQARDLNLPAAVEQSDSVARRLVSSTDRLNWNEIAHLALILLLAIVTLFSVPPQFYVVDDVARSKLAQGQAVEPYLLPSVRKYSIIQPMLMSPLAKLDDQFFRRPTMILRFNWLVMSAGLCGMFLLLRRRWERIALLRFILLMQSASMLPHFVLGCHAELLSAMSIMFGLAALAVNRPLLGGPFLVIGSVNTPALLPALGLALLARAIPLRRFGSLWIFAAAVATFLLENKLHRGQWLVSGYEGDVGTKNIMPYSGLPGFSYPLFFGLLGIFFSFGKGLIFFTPGLFLRPFWSEAESAPLARSLTQARSIKGARSQRAFHRMSVWFVVGMCLVYARWWAWYGGWTWGPRFFLFACVPASLALATRIEHARRSPPAAILSLMALLLSGWVAVSGLVFGIRDVQLLQGQDEMDYLANYATEFSVLWHPFVGPTKLSAWDVGCFAAYGLAICWLAAPLWGPAGLGIWRFIRQALEREA